MSLRHLQALSIKGAVGGLDNKVHMHQYNSSISHTIKTLQVTQQ